MRSMESEVFYSLAYMAFMELHGLVLELVPAGRMPEWICDTPVESLEELAVMRTEGREENADVS